MEVPTSHEVDCAVTESLHQLRRNLLLSVAVAKLTVHPWSRVRVTVCIMIQG